jgi:hypothetical protein
MKIDMKIQRTIFVAAFVCVMRPVTEIVGKLQVSMAKFPNIKPGEEFKGYK